MRIGGISVGAMAFIGQIVCAVALMAETEDPMIWLGAAITFNAVGLLFGGVRVFPYQEPLVPGPEVDDATRAAGGTTTATRTDVR